MKKVIFLLVVFLQLQNLAAVERGKTAASGPRFSLTALAGLRAFANNDFKQIYKGSQAAFGLELGYRLGRKIEVFVSGDHLAATGELTHTREATSFRVIALEGGARFALPLGRFVPYAGAGAGYYLVKEENVIATLDEKKAGFFALGGLRFRFAKALFAAVQVKIVALKLKPFNESVDLGGWFAGAGIGVTF